MTGTLVTKQNKSGQSYFYIKLSYKNPVSHKWCQKMVSTHLEVKGNKRKAESLKMKLSPITLIWKRFQRNTMLKSTLTLHYVSIWIAGLPGKKRTRTFYLRIL